ncbi:methionine-tRNA ligase [Fonsecaea pedrosoi CBS 271.37]|uniref:Probable methionine--tRNA ligase, mitochondrial n=1 Tax=Fonsecaea pedrosoi CBS 271.37 TaxID=1442368 RepID=A0A0D2FD78_9EURO|nr:methionine-tRNA ligase [Fonsecaea pedrosoi CBS 271.37]KIW84582.1 methionine-tRNA ligase [Fonsecaea pedrosoi CBS 271.37]
MLALERNARSFFLQCRASARCQPWRPVLPRGNSQRRTLAAAIEPESSTNAYAHALAGKPYYVTTPIFYVNSGMSPHVGHLYTLVLADVLKRWAKLRGDTRATLLTGTDEHGMKVQKAAQKANTDVKLFCDHHAEQFKALCDAANIDYDRFIRTTDEDHKDVVRYVWEELNRAGFIYEAKHEGWYSVSDETFYPSTQVHKVLDPSTGITKIVSIETGKDVEWTSEMNYHFRLSEFQAPLLKYYENHAGAIVPKQRMAFIMDEIRSGLKDLSVSRPSSRLTWGIQVPGDESQTIYVWLDALFNYLTMTGYPFVNRNDANMMWPPNCQVIGKDIIRFHTIYWPAFLMALNLPVADRFLTHAHWTMNNEKMSKSAGNGVNPFYAMDRFGVDCIRFFMAHNGGIVDDATYDNSFIEETYNHLLRGGLGNLIHRVYKSKHFDVRGAVKLVKEDENFSKFITRDQWSASDMEMKAIHANLRGHHARLCSVREIADNHMKEPDPRKAVQSICELIGETNKLFHNSEVWKLIKSTDPETRRIANYILFTSADSIRVMAILLQPFMPQRMKAALDLMEVDESRRTFDDAVFGADFTYGPPALGPDAKASTEVVFPMLLSVH